MRKHFLAVLAVFTLSLLFSLVPQNEVAASGGFNAGRIIDDAIFTNANSMSSTDIQNFFNSRNSVCLKNHTTQEPLGNNKYGGTVSAAHAIWKAGQLFGINPQVLLATLEKEQGLITRKDCPQWRYQTALGYGCPDTAPCSTFGFSVQLYQGARHFRGFFDQNAGWYIPYTPGVRYIQYNPNPACGGSDVNIQNRATASLYSYTPYQPNPATLAVPIGQTAHCGAYGNKNFWYFFTTWFGTATQRPLDSCPTGTANCVWSFINNANGHFFYTENKSERTAVYKDRNYSYLGISFFTRKYPPSNALPVYRLYSGSTQRHIFTANPNEKAYLLNTGWKDEGVAFYSDPAWANTGYKVKRFYNKNGNGSHILTSDEKEINRLIAAGYTDEGTVFRSTSPTLSPALPQTGNENIYRFLIKGRHMFTSSIAERDYLIGGGHTYEGIAWQSPHAGNPEKHPIYRLYDTREGKHFWTSSSNERDILMRMGFWRYEGIGMYASPSGKKPVYRFYNTKTGAHIFTVSDSERASILTYPNYRYEGVAWRL